VPSKHIVNNNRPIPA